MKHLLRSMVRSPGFFAVVLVTLALGIGANTAIFSVVRGVLLRPLPFHEPERLVDVGDDTILFQGSAMSVLEFRDTKRQAQRLESMAAYAPGDANLTGAGVPERIPVGYVTPDFFPVLGVPAARGRWIAADEDQPGKDHVVVITHDLWKRRFGGDPAIVGKSVVLDNESYHVIGVLPASFKLHTRFDAYAPLTFPPGQFEENARDRHWLSTVARMKRGVSLPELNRELAFLGARMRAEHPNVYAEESRWRPGARPLVETAVGDIRPSLLLLAGAAGLVLIIVCANIANLLLARASTRERELSVRAAVGATRRRLLAQLLGESLFLSAIGGALGVVVALWGTDLLLSLAPEGLPRADEIRVDGAVLAFSVGVTALTGMIFGLIPAWSASRVHLADALRASGRTTSAGRRPRRMRRALVVAETALALVLVTSAALITKSFARVMSVAPGFQADDVLTLKVTLPYPIGEPTPEDRAKRKQWFAGARERLLAVPGVSEASGINIVPLRDTRSDRLIDIEGVATDPAHKPDAQIRGVLPGYFEAMRIPLLKGRSITPGDDAQTTPVMVVSESFARKHWPDGDALGHRIRMSSPEGPWVTIVGVVGDVHDQGLDFSVDPTMYMALLQSDDVVSSGLVVRGTLSLPELTRAVRGALERYDPQQPIYDVRTMRDLLDEASAPRRFVLVLFELFAALALGLAALGLYGVLAHAVAERQHEIGVRVALGATRRHVMALIAREGLVLVALGVALGLGAGFAGSHLLTSFLYQVAPTDPLALLVAVVILAGAAALAMWIPLRRALRVDPMIALREE